MCITVFVPQGIRLIRASTKAQLREALGGVDPFPRDEVWPGNSCLCPCDVEATAAAAGRSIAERDELGDYVLTPREGSNPKGECPPGPRVKPEEPGAACGTRPTNSRGE